MEDSKAIPVEVVYTVVGEIGPSTSRIELMHVSPEAAKEELERRFADAGNPKKIERVLSTVGV